jgi:acetylornithine deacetylase/succinyl-diaminopimelate desuccinylase-like protein
MRARIGCCVLFETAIVLVPMVDVSLAASAAYHVSAQTQAAYLVLGAHPLVQQGLAFLQKDHENTIADQKAIATIPAPPFKEQARAEDFRKRLAALNLVNVGIDGEGNACGIRPGRAKGPPVLVEAHLDTVFPEGTNTGPVERDGTLYGPGIIDDSRGLAALLSLVRALNATGIRTVGDILFCGTVGEEGLGDLRGMKALFRDRPGIVGSVSIDGTTANRITYLATGSQRYEIAYTGPGGHSFDAFGTPSAIHAMGRAVAKIAELRTPLSPKTTFTVGTVTGGTSVNAIAAAATMFIEMRSNSQAELARLVTRILRIVQQAADEENDRWGSDKIQTMITLRGDRPTGSQPAAAAIVQAAWMATRTIGQQPHLTKASSTNANLPISLGVPAITIGGGGRGGREHSLDEWFSPKEAYLGPQMIYATVLGLAGVDGVSQPLLPGPGGAERE